MYLEDLKWRRRKLEIKFTIFFRPLTGDKGKKALTVLVARVIRPS